MLERMGWPNYREIVTLGAWIPWRISALPVLGCSQHPRSDLLRIALITYLQPSIIVGEKYSSDQSSKKIPRRVCSFFSPLFNLNIKCVIYYDHAHGIDLCA